MLVSAKERAHSKADKVIGRIGHRFFALVRLALQRLTNLYPRVGLLACVPFPQAPVFIETEHDGFGRQLGSSGRYNNGRDALILFAIAGSFG